MFVVIVAFILLASPLHKEFSDSDDEAACNGVKELAVSEVAPEVEESVTSGVRTKSVDKNVRGKLLTTV